MTSLPRRLRLGIELGADASFSDRGAVVTRVAPSGMAAAAGMQAGDLLTALDAYPVRSRVELQVALRSAGMATGGDDRVTLGFQREGTAMEKTVSAVRAPREDGVLYDAVRCADGVQVRTMIDAAAKGARRRPAIVFVQGLSLATMDAAFPELFRGWREEGFITMRIEKRGIGDSEGEAPAAGDFATEVADLRAAVLELCRHELVDPEGVFIFGHSVGGMIAPKLEVDAHVRGYITYGSSAEPWLDCLEASARRQWAMQRRGSASDAIALEARALRDEIATAAVTDGRSALYHQQLHDAGIAASWTHMRRPVLVLHGAYDWVVTDDEARRIAELAGGSFEAVPHLDHLMTAHDSLEASMESYGKGRRDPLEIVAASCRWMHRLLTPTA